MEVKRARQGGTFSFKFLTSGGLGLVRLLAHLKANKLKEDHFLCAALLTLSWTRQGSKLGGLGLILRPIWFSHTFRWSTKKLKGRDRHGGVLPSFQF